MKRANRLYLIRHGQTRGYENYPVYGHTDAELTDTGMLQLQQLAERLRFAPLHAIYCSDLQRSLQGARMIARYHDVPLHSLVELREMFFGDWEGLNLKDIRDRFPEQLSRRAEDLVGFAPPGRGESLAGFAGRVNACFQGILAAQADKDIAIVAHGGVNRVLLCGALGVDLAGMFRIQQDYGCLNIIDYFSDNAVVRLMNG